ncbi:hypothetical protein CFC21_098361 [Triticum aestivum]|uniref:F-box protein AT5G49610-like beta-propeller domain-containing protein n=2 Tax=Triticum aestivum TaxID=4565 RepID=A0A3B5Y3A8_WHEAT|nr:hypothetical protein CFC21_098361 [Triticum aestivum]
MAAELVRELGEIEELVEEILIRLLKDESGNLLRSFLVCKPWRDLLAGDGFRRRYGDFHQTPPMLGFFHIWPEPCAEFIPTTDFVAPDLNPRHHYSVEDCRHGRVLLRYIDEDENIPLLVVWDPMTGSETLLGSLEKLGTGSWSASVLCAADNCRHGDCQSGPFRVVFVFLHHEEEIATACVYSSETGSWSSSAVTDVGTFEDEIYFSMPSVLAGDALYFLLFRGQDVEGCSILKYDLGTSCLSEIHLSEEIQDAINSPILIASDDGRLGLADLFNFELSIWWREVDPDGVASWAERRDIDLETLLPTGDFKISPELVGSIEGTDIIFATTSLGTYEIDLKSLTSPLKMLSSWLNQDPNVKWTILPYVSFYYPPAVDGIVDEESSEDGHGNEEA